LAWTVLFSAFAVFCILAIGFPLVVRGYLLGARRPLFVQLNAQRGIVRVERQGNGGIDAAGLEDASPLELFKGDGLRTGRQDEGLLTLQRGEQGERETLVSVVVYDNSNLLVEDAYSPRFGLSSGAHEAVLRLRDGRARVDVQAANDGRPVRVEVRTSQTDILLNEGSYALEVNNEQTSITVRSGRADVRTAQDQLVVLDEQRCVAASSGELDGPLPAERNLVRNGDFAEGLDAGWTVFFNSSGEPPTVTGVVDEEGAPVAWFEHVEPQPAEISLIQTLNRNVKDLESLVLHLKVRVNYQSLPVCGSLGSECPVMVRLDYIDGAGSPRQWVLGFYAFDDPNINVPYYCTTCPGPTSGNHIRVPQSAWYLFDSPNLMEALPAEWRPSTLQSVHVYASGHSYDSMVTDVELLAQE
jgi:hypothetical protein